MNLPASRILSAITAKERDGLVTGCALLLLLWALLAPAAVEAGEDAEVVTSRAAVLSDWQPKSLAPGPTSRTGPSFEGMGYLFPLRLHLSRGGYIDGGMGGIDTAGGRMLLLLARGDLLVDFRLIRAVTPLADVERQADILANAGPPPLVGGVPAKYRWVPTWRSHLGVLLSFLLPGAGQFIQKREQAVGALVMSGVFSTVAVGLLALYGPSTYGPEARDALAGIFFGLGGSIAIGGAVHAYRTGRVRRQVP